MRERTKDEQAKVFLCNKLKITKNSMDNGLESFVQKGGPSLILNLILEKHV